MRIVHFFKAVGTGEIIDRCVNIRRRCRITLPDHEAVDVLADHLRLAEKNRPGYRRCLLQQPTDKLFDSLRFTFGVDQHLSPAILYPSVNTGFYRCSIHKGSEPHTLHLATEQQATGGLCFYSGYRFVQECNAATAASRMPLAHQIRQAPSSETIQGPTG